MSVVAGLDEDELDDEDRAILAEISKKGYYHGRPKSETCAAPTRIDSPQPILVPANGRTAEEIRQSRTAFDDFQKKWDRFDCDDYIDELEAKLTVDEQPECDAVDFDLMLVGDACVGKTALLVRHLSGAFADSEREGSPTEAATRTLRFWSNCGEIKFHVQDLAMAPRKPGGRRVGDKRLRSCHCAVVMFDVTSEKSYDSLPFWCNEVKRVCGAVPTVLVGNKVDLPDRQVPRSNVDIYRKRGLQYYDIGVRNNFQIEKPFLWLAQRLVGQPKLRFVGPPAMAPSANVDPALAPLHARQLAEAQAVPVAPEEADR